MWARARSRGRRSWPRRGTARASPRTAPPGDTSRRATHRARRRRSSRSRRDATSSAKPSAGRRARSSVLLPAPAQAGRREQRRERGQQRDAELEAAERRAGVGGGGGEALPRADELTAQSGVERVEGELAAPGSADREVDGSRDVARSLAPAHRVVDGKEAVVVAVELVDRGARAAAARDPRRRGEQAVTGERRASGTPSRRVTVWNSSKPLSRAVASRALSARLSWARARKARLRAAVSTRLESEPMRCASTSRPCATRKSVVVHASSATSRHSPRASER